MMEKQHETGEGIHHNKEGVDLMPVKIRSNILVKQF